MSLYSHSLLRAARPYLKRSAIGGANVILFGYDARVLRYCLGYDLVGEHAEGRCGFVYVVEHRPPLQTKTFWLGKRFEGSAIHPVIVAIDKSRIQSPEDMADWVGAWRVDAIVVSYDYGLDYEAMTESGVVVRRPRRFWQTAPIVHAAARGQHTAPSPRHRQQQQHW